jgi:hypothetical protein
MTDANAAAPASADTAAAAATALAAAAATANTGGNNEGASNGSGTNVAQTQIPDWTAPLEEDTRAIVKAKGWKNQNEAIKSYKELVTKLGEPRLEIPAADAAKEVHDAFFAKLGRPATPAEYKFGVPEGVPETTPYDADFATSFKNWAHEAGLSPKQASAIHDNYVKSMATGIGAAQAAQSAKITGTHAALVKEWGDTDTEGYRRNVELARRAVQQLDLTASLKGAGIIDPQSGMVTDVKVAQALARVGAKMYAEDTMYSGPTAVTENPFDKSTFNMTKQAVMIKNDPARAAILIRASGQKPVDFGLEQ